MIGRSVKVREKDQTEELLSLFFRFKDIWRIALINDGPAEVKSLKVHLIPGTLPRKAKMRLHTPAHLNFLHFQTRNLEKLGYVK
jgi:hypothetical protein